MEETRHQNTIKSKRYWEVLLPQIPITFKVALFFFFNFLFYLAFHLETDAIARCWFTDACMIVVPWDKIIRMILMFLNGKQEDFITIFSDIHFHGHNIITIKVTIITLEFPWMITFLANNTKVKGRQGELSNFLKMYYPLYEHKRQSSRLIWTFRNFKFQYLYCVKWMQQGPNWDFGQNWVFYCFWKNVLKTHNLRSN